MTTDKQVCIVTQNTTQFWLWHFHDSLTLKNENLIILMLKLEFVMIFCMYVYIICMYIYISNINNFFDTGVDFCQSIFMNCGFIDILGY